MSDRRRLRLDLAAGAMLLAALAAAAAVLSFEPGRDNLLGPVGAAAATELFAALGIGTYVLLAGWFVLALVLFLRKDLLTWSLRLAGWVLLIPCATLLAERLSPSSGGNLGQWINELLPAHLDDLGQLLAPAGCLALGLVLSASFAFLTIQRVAWRTLSWLARSSHHRRTDFQSVRPSKGLTDGLEIRPTNAALNHMIGEKSGLAALRRREPGTVSLGRRLLRRLTSLRFLFRHSRTEVPVRRLTAKPAFEPVGPGIPITHANAAASAGALPEAVREDYELPPLTLLDEPKPFPHDLHDELLRETATLLEKTFLDFGLRVKVAGIHTGPVITQYEVTLETGLRVGKVISLADDLALNLKVPSVRIAPITGKNTVGIEVPNEHRAIVNLKELMVSSPRGATRGHKLPLFLGKDTEGKPLVYDLAEMPHLLIAGRTGTGKSVCMNAIILSLLMTRRPDEVKMIMIDPKMLEMSEYGRVPHLMHPVVKDMKKAEAILAWAVDKMEERYDILSRARVRSIAGYNELPPEEIHRRLAPENDEDRRRIQYRMPYIVLFIDEMADLILMLKKEVEGHIIRLAQKSRAAGIHLVVATQKPTVDVITGLIKSNLPARICFQVSSRTDSRVVLDEMGADKLLGKGDMLFLQPGTSTILRGQGAYAANEEIMRVTEHLECDPEFETELVELHTSRDGKGGFLESLRARDELYEQAIDVVLREGRGSVSLLQRALGIGYGRSARLIDFMAEDGIVGTYNGSQARDVLYTPEQWQQMKQSGQRQSA